MESTGNSPLKLADLKAKMRLEGKVSKIGMAGAYIDVGLGQPGLLHISQLSRTAVNRVEDVLQEGQQVEVPLSVPGEGAYFAEVDLRTDRFQATGRAGAVVHRRRARRHAGEARRDRTVPALQRLDVPHRC